jgi:hypothetical protein
MSESTAPHAATAPGWWPAGDAPQATGASVRCSLVDEAGAPVADALVTCDGRQATTTDESGAFVFELGQRGTVDVVFRARALLDLSLEGVDTTTLDGRTFVMRRGRSVRLTVVDERGDPFVRPPHMGRCCQDWETWATAPGNACRFRPDDGLPWSAPRSMGGSPSSPAGPGVYDFLALPEGRVIFRVEGVEGPVYTLEHDTSIPAARLVVPAHGSVRLNLEKRLDDCHIRVIVEPLDPKGTKLSYRDGLGLPYQGTFLLPALLPGDYVVTIERPSEPDAQTWVPIGHAVRFTVVAGETTAVTVGP